jgi:phosphohistidine phosphatase
MKIYILRHGLAVDRGAPGIARDFDRPLTPKGKRKLRKISSAIKKRKIAFDQIFTSPYVRARQTAEMVAESLGLADRVQRTECLSPEGNPTGVVHFLIALKPRGEKVLLVGHEPNLSELISFLSSGHQGTRINLKKGALCRLSADKLRNGKCAALDWLLTPKQLCMLS